jgi:hypothetical protein
MARTTQPADRIRGVLFPDPPRRIPGHRWTGVVLRTVHLAAFGILLGGHAFDVDAGRLEPFLVVTVASGAAMMLLEMASTCAWLFLVKGMAVLGKLALLLLVPVLWDHRVTILLLVVVVASVAAHMPSRLRHYSLLARRSVEPPRRPEPLLARGRSR